MLYCIEIPVPIHGKERSCICMYGVLILSLSTICLLELFRQCTICLLELFRQCTICLLELFRQCGIFLFFILLMYVKHGIKITFIHDNDDGIYPTFVCILLKYGILAIRYNPSNTEPCIIICVIHDALFSVRHQLGMRENPYDVFLNKYKISL